MERLLTRGLVDTLSRFEANGMPVTSVYLAFDPATEHRREALSRLKSLVSAHWDKVLSGRSRAHKTTLEGDMKKFMAFLEKMPKVEVTGLAMYGCSARGFFETVGVAVPFNPQIIVADRPAVGPLLAALDEFRRIAVCLVDRRRVKLYEYFMGRMEEVLVFSDDVPSRVRVAGWGGYEEGRISRRVIEHENAHFKNVGDVLFEQFKLRGFDWLFLGARGALREELERSLHAYVHERLKAYIDAGLTTPADEVRRLTREAAERLKAEDNRKMAANLVAAARAGALAVAGLRNVLQAVNAAAVSTLMVSQGAARAGVVCKGCGMLGLRRSDCKSCGAGMTRLDDIVETAVAAALARGAAVRRVKGESALDAKEGVGAFVRFPVRRA